MLCQLKGAQNDTEKEKIAPDASVGADASGAIFSQTIY